MSDGFDSDCIVDDCARPRAATSDYCLFHATRTQPPHALLPCKRDHCTKEEREVIEAAMLARQNRLISSAHLVANWDYSRGHWLHEWGSELDRIGATPLIDKATAAEADRDAAVDALLATRAKTEETTK